MSPEIEIRREANQIGKLQRPGDTKWSSHFNSICSLLRTYNTTILLLEDLTIKGSTYSQRGDATYALKVLMSFDFIFILHVLKEIMGITDKLCQDLKQKSQHILNSMCLVSTTKLLIQNLRDCAIQIPDMNGVYLDIIRSRWHKDSVIEEHHYRTDIFTTIIDYQLKELNSRFNPKDAFKSFDARDIYNLVEKFYSVDFLEQEKIQVEYELQHYELDVPKDPNFQNLSTIIELCQKLVLLVLTLPVSTTTIERAFSAMKIIKKRLQNKTEDGFLTDYMIVYIEMEIAEKFTADMIIDDFYEMKHRRAQLKK
ncbi:Ribonuclease H-like protein [Dioscorea alata]|uniref:Ribonuclease H-like protein n=1 Tax=Dioscorea alata TaxID=55571 RepID=A0ACB7UD08_DIOAL|nr:Ribonuclease H-like protein [Dioscorea alata]